MVSRTGRRWLAAIVLVACAALLDAGNSSQAAEPVAGSGPGVADATVPVWLRGVWTREWIDEGGTKSNPRAVIYLQTPVVFANMRIPVDWPSFAGVAGPWQIERSTLRWREGQRLDFVDEITVSNEPGGLRPRRSGDEHWSVVTSTLSNAELLALFGSGVELPAHAPH